MSLHHRTARRQVRRDANEPEIIKALHKAGAVVRPSRDGFDLLVGYEGKLFTLEVKDGSKPPSARKLTSDEIEWQEICRYHHLPHFVVLSPEDALQAIGATH